MKKRFPALLLCLALLAGMIPTALAVNVYDAASGAFPEFDSAMGYYMTTTSDKDYLDPNVVNTRNYTADRQIEFDSCIQYAREYIDLLTGLGTFEVASALSANSAGDRYTAHLRYTGSAPMKGTLKGMRADGTWPAYGAYHLTVLAEYNEYARPERRSVITVRWDSGLTAVATDLRTPSGKALGVGEDTSTAQDNRLPDQDATEPTGLPDEDWNGWDAPDNDAPRKPGESVTNPQEEVDFTVVLGIGYNKMSVAGEVVPVDEANDQVCPLAVNNRTLVPVSRIVAAFGGESSWDPKTNNTTYTLGKRKVEHVIGSADVLIQKGSQRQKKTMETASMAMNNRTYVPVRYVLEGLGLWVGYEPTYQLVVVSTASQAGKDLVGMYETQRLFASEPVPDTARKILEHYTIDDFNYTMEVGESLTLYNSRTAISGFSAYTWEILDGGELVKMTPNSAVCSFYAKRPGVVTLQSHLDETIVNYFGPSTHNEVTYTMTITITPATSSGSAGGLMHYQPCPTCNGTGKIQVGSRRETCPTCLGDKNILL